MIDIIKYTAGPDGIAIPERELRRICAHYHREIEEKIIAHDNCRVSYLAGIQDAFHELLRLTLYEKNQRK